MYTLDIEMILASDMLNRRAGTCKVLLSKKLSFFIDRTKTACFVINTDPSYNRGKHWITCFMMALGLGNILFHSIYLYNITEIATFIERNSERPYIYNPQMLQHLISNACGLYHVYFLLIKAIGGSIQSVLNHFPPPNNGRKIDWYTSW